VFPQREGVKNPRGFLDLRDEKIVRGKPIFPRGGGEPSVRKATQAGALFGGRKPSWE
jgi:hypothetical protein